MWQKLFGIGLFGIGLSSVAAMGTALAALFYLATGDRETPAVLLTLSIAGLGAMGMFAMVTFIAEDHMDLTLAHEEE